MIYPITGWSEIMQYSKKKAMEISNLLETMWLVWYPWPVEITYGWRGEFLGHEFKNILIENEYGIRNNTDYPGNPQVNEIIYRINQVLGNLLSTYNLREKCLDDSDPWMGILAEANLAVQSTYHRTKKNSGPISIWPRHDPTNKSPGKLEINTSA